MRSTRKYVISLDPVNRHTMPILHHIWLSTVLGYGLGKGEEVFKRIDNSMRVSVCGDVYCEGRWWGVENLCCKEE